MTSLLSHPDQDLIAHLSGVCEWALMLSANRQVSFWDSSTLIDTIKIVSLAHDFGKATPYFQKYIKDPAKKRGGPLARHALLSAIVGYWLAKHCFEDRQDTKKLCFFIYVAIKRHHGNLLNMQDEFLNFSEKDQELLLKQVRSLDFSVLNNILEPLVWELPPALAGLFPFSREMLEEWVLGMKEELRDVSMWWLKNEEADKPLFGDYYESHTKYTLDNYFKFIYIYSLLLDSDKKQVGVRKYQGEFVELPFDLVDNYKKQMSWDKTSLNDARERAYIEIANNLYLAERSNLFKITLPTGMGKTLAAYNFAFKLRDKRYRERGMPPKIFYVLPFLSVIDQNYDVLSEAIEKQGLLTGSNVLIKHHHLAEPVYTMRSGEDELIYSPNASKLLIEGWSAEVIVTTFVQLFETLIGWRNSCLRRFHNLANSIIILDEIQALPVSYWQLAQKVLEFAVKNMNVDVLLVTATQPKIFTGDIEPTELVDFNKYFIDINRITLRVDLRRRTINEFAELIEDEINAQTDKSYLFVFNTIASAKQFYKLLEQIVNEPVAFLSTGVVMKQRCMRLKDIKERKYRFVVSTQLVEAGVDIDFDVVYRDFAPMDSINQSAGRCNRNNLGENHGIVNVIYLVRDDKKRTFASMIYNSTSLDITKEILHEENISENRLLELIEMYFQLAKDKSRASESFQLLEALQNMRFYSDDCDMPGINDFKLIKQQGVRANIFIETDREAEEVWLEYEDILNNCKDFYLRQEKFELIKKEFYQNVISVTVNEGMNLPPEVNNFYYVNRYQLKSYYDPNLGFDTSNYENIF